jgi:superfamily II DNA helicase RecQ
MEVPELLKADQAPGAVKAIIQRHKRARFSPNPFNSDAIYVLTRVEMGRLVQFLLTSHTPLNGAGRHATAGSPIAPTLFDLPEPQCDRDTFERLKLLRRRLAQERNVAAYMVFSDETLRLMAAYLPRNEWELLRVRGVGPKKAEEYGGAFLEAIEALRSA